MTHLRWARRQLTERYGLPKTIPSYALFMHVLADRGSKIDIDLPITPDMAKRQMVTLAHVVARQDWNSQH